jgi:predicted RND superfamily exporter protein
MLFGAGTTLAGFLAFFFSSIPCIVQMAIFAAVGVVTAVLLSLVVLPHVVSGKPSPRAKRSGQRTCACATSHCSAFGA